MPMPGTPRSSRHASLQRPVYASGVNQVCPFQLTYCRSSSQTGHDGGGEGASGNWAPHCSQMKMDIGWLRLCGLTAASRNAIMDEAEYQDGAMGMTGMQS